MSNQFKPYRLINSRELNELQQTFADNLNPWNEQYALLPLHCQLRNQFKCPQSNQWHLFSTETGLPVALITEHGLSGIKHALFGELAACFNHIGQFLMHSLIKHLFENDSLQMSKTDNIPVEQWFYNGSPALALTLNPELTVYLNPQWVITLLPTHETLREVKSDLYVALSPQTIQCQVELNPVSLQLKDVLQLQVGDVIKTDHLITQPLLVKKHKQPICKATLCETNQHKSIEIKSLL